MTQSKKIAVTGGIGSGKTEFCNILKKFGYPVFSCDEISHALWKDEAYLSGLAELFPTCVVDGTVQKSRVSALVFSDKAALEKLNAYAHPRIMQKLLDEMQADPVSVAEVPLLFEGGFERLFDAVVIVKREEETRIKSAARRDHLAEEEIRARVRAQNPHEEKEGGKFIVVENNGSIGELFLAAERVIKKLGI